MLILRGTKEYSRALMQQWDLTIRSGWPRLRTRLHETYKAKTCGKMGTAKWTSPVTMNKWH